MFKPTAKDPTARRAEFAAHHAGLAVAARAAGKPALAANHDRLVRNFSAPPAPAGTFNPFHRPNTSPVWG